MFDLLRRWSMMTVSWHFDKDNPGPGGQTDDGAGDPDPEKDKTDPKAGDDKATDPATEKKFSQAELDAIIEDRLKRAEKTAEKAAEKARKAAEDAALAKNQEWQTLAETRAKEIADLTRERDELSPLQDQVARYRTALETQLSTVKEGLPKHLRALIDPMDPVDQLNYISTHAKDLAIAPAGYGETPNPKERKLKPDEEKDAQRASRSIVTNNF